jgi:hypothetical protein
MGDASRILASSVQPLQHNQECNRRSARKRVMLQAGVGVEWHWKRPDTDRIVVLVQVRGLLVAARIHLPGFLEIGLGLVLPAKALVYPAS